MRAAGEGQPQPPPSRFRALALALILTLALTAVLTACGGGGPVLEGQVTVELRDIQFEPAEITVRQGTSVTWINRDPVIHNVRAIDGSFLSQDVMEEGDTFTFRFDIPGTYRYVCTYHEPNQVGKVVVVE